MGLTKTDTELVYSPSALLSVFANTLNNDATKRMFKIKGVYTQGKGANYNGFYYDILKDETSEAAIALVVPALIRSQLSPNQIIECQSYLSKKVHLNSGRIDLNVNIVELVSKLSVSYSETQLKTFEILERRAQLGRKDVDTFIKSKIINGEKVTINIIIGKSAIIDEDIKHQLQGSIGYYNINFIKTSLTSVNGIIDALKYYQDKGDIVAIARGGGENLEIFDNPKISEMALTLTTYLVTALGHKENAPLLEKIADKHFITPSALGQYFNEIYDNTISELQNSKARLVDVITKQLEANYNKQISNMRLNIEFITASGQKQVDILNQQLEIFSKENTSMTNKLQDMQMRVEKNTGINWITILFIVTALIIGLLIGKLLV